MNNMKIIYNLLFCCVFITACKSQVKDNFTKVICLKSEDVFLKGKEDTLSIEIYKDGKLSEGRYIEMGEVYRTETIHFFNDSGITKEYISRDYVKHGNKTDTMVNHF